MKNFLDSIAIDGSCTAASFTGSGAGLTGIPNGALSHASFTLGGTTINLGDSVASLTGLNTVAATNLTGTLTTAAQPNVTSLGTLTSLTVSGTFTASGANLASGTIPVSALVLPGGTTKFLRADGTWQVISGGSTTWSNITGTPTTVAGYGITDAITTANIGSQTVATANGLNTANNYTVNGMTVSSYLTFTTANGTWSPGTIAISNLGGLANICKTGSSYDWSVWTPNAGTFIFGVQTGTINVAFAGQVTASQFNGSGAGLTGTASGLTVGYANSVAWTNVSGRPTALSSFTNDSGFITGVTTASSVNRLVGSSAGGAKTATWTAAQIALNNASNPPAAVAFLNMNCTLNLASAGANGLQSGYSVAASTVYDVWAIATGSGGTLAVFAVPTGVTPTLPGGYNYKMLIGFVLTDSSKNVVAFNQREAAVTFKSPQILCTGAQGTYNVTTPTWAAKTVCGVILPALSNVATAMFGVCNFGGANLAMIAPDSTYGGPQSTTKPCFCALASTGSWYGGLQFYEFALSAASIAVVHSSATSTYTYVLGCRINL